MSKTDLSTISRSKLEKKLAAYFDKKNRKTFSLTGLALHLGVTRRCLTDFSKSDEIGDLIAEAKLKCENLLEERMIAGVPPTGMIFILKNNYGWTDKMEIDQNIKGTISLASLFDRSQQLKQANESTPIEGTIVEEKKELPDTLFETKEKLPSELF